MDPFRLLGAAAPSLTARAAALAPEDLAAMARIVRELSPHERQRMLPLAHLDMEAMRAWLLAGTEEFGIRESAAARRRTRRDERWSLMAIGHGIDGDRWSSSRKLISWDGSLYSLRMGFLRAFSPARPSGLPAGDRRAMKTSTGPFGEFSILISLFAAEALAMTTAASDGGVKGFLCAMGISFFIVSVFSRSLDFYAIGPAGRRCIGAQAVLPFWRKALNRHAASKEARACSRDSHAAPTPDQIEASILRASLGQGPTAAEERLRMLEQSEIDETRASLARARDPSANLADMEALDMLGATQSPQTTLAKKSSRL